MINSAAIAAAKAYAAQSKALEQGITQTEAGTGTGFADLLKSTLEATGETAKAADAGLMAQASGKAEMVDVVTAVAEAELTVQTIVAVRDRVISAYQEILRMPI